jgi:hypothetical protein
MTKGFQGRDASDAAMVAAGQSDGRAATGGPHRQNSVFLVDPSANGL